VSAYRLPRIAAALGVLLAAAAAEGQFTNWWKTAWKFRRLVTVETPPTKLPGDDAAVVQFPTHAALAPDGRDVRVVVANRQEVPCRVLFVGPGDLCRVVFAVDKNVQQYSIYYGNPDAPAAKDDWLPQRGLLLESRKWPAGGNLNRLDRVRATMFARAADVLGRDYVPEIFWGQNPFASTGDECNYFAGWLVCRDAGVYEFATTSDDASFLTVDGNLVVEWPGVHGPRHDARFTGKIQLTAGLHKIEYYHVNLGEYGMAVAAWKPPSAGRIDKIPAAAFAPIFHAKLGKLDANNQRRTADFTWRHDGEAFFANRYVQRYAFQAAAPEGIRPATVRWDFGDGIAAGGTEVVHVFLSDGPRKVSLEYDWMGEKHRIVNTVAVERDWSQQDSPRLIGLNQILKLVADYDWPKMSGADLRAAIDLFTKLERTDDLLNVCAAVVASPSAAESARTEAALLAADLYVAKRSEPDAAVALLASVAGKAADPALRARLQLKQARILIDELGDKAATDAAEKLLTQVQKAENLDRALARGALAGLGDVWRRRGDGEKARGFYQQADEISIFRRNHTQNVVRIGALARYVEDYVRSGAWDDAKKFLEDWEWEYPLERLAGYSTLLRVKMAEGQELPDKAAALALETVRANPLSPYADQLLLRAADDYKQVGDTKLAVETAQRLVSEYPESPLVGQVKTRLKQWTEPPASRPVRR
jgi:tetratricopeptide (TPR) repeat protein